MCYFYYHFHLLKSYYTAEQALYRYIIQLYIDGTWRAFEFEGAVWNSLGEWKYFYLKSK